MTRPIIRRFIEGLQALLSSRAFVLVACMTLTCLVIRILWGFSLDRDSRGFIVLLESGLAGPLDLYRWGGPDGETERWVAAGFLPWHYMSDSWMRDSWMIWFRPITSALFSGIHWIFGSEPLPYLLTTLLLFFGFVAATAKLLRSVMVPPLAGLAILLLVLDDMHSEPLFYVSAMHTCMATMLSLLGVVAHIRWRRGSRSGLWIALGCWLLALLTSEAGLGPLALILALEAFGVPSHTHRLRAIVPATLLAVGYVIFFRLLHFGPHLVVEYADPISQPQRYIEVALKNLPLMLGEGVLGDDRPTWLALVLTLAALPFFWGGLRSRPVAERRGIGALLVGSLLAVIPALGSIWDFDEHWIDNRMLLVPSIGFSVFWSVALWQAAHWSYASARALPRLLAVLAAVGIAGLTLVWSPVVLVRELRIASIPLRRFDQLAIKFKKGVSRCGPSQEIIWVRAPSFSFPLGWNDAFHRQSVLAVHPWAFNITRTGERQIRIRIQPPDRPVGPAIQEVPRMVRYRGSEVRRVDDSHIVASFSRPPESLCLLALNRYELAAVLPLPAIGETTWF